MDDLSVWEIFTLESAAWTMAAFLGLLVVRMWSGAPAMFAQWIAWRKSLADAKSADWNRRGDEIRRLDERCQRLEAAEQKCRDELSDKERRLAELEGFMTGQGQARQEAAGVVALERSARHGDARKDKPE